MNSYVILKAKLKFITIAMEHHVHIPHFLTKIVLLSITIFKVVLEIYEEKHMFGDEVPFIWE